MSELPITAPNSLFSKMIMTMCEKSGTSGRGVIVGSSEGDGALVAAGGGMGGRVGGKGAGADSVKAGWQAKRRKEAMIVIHNIFFMTVLYDTHSHNLRFPLLKKRKL
jgi:hypothetical protein